MRDHRKLRAFELTDTLVTVVYQATRAFSKEELFGLTSQMRRAAISAVSNIVEGCARETQKEYVQFLNVAFGSLRELGYHIHLAGRLGYLSKEKVLSVGRHCEEAIRVLSGLLRALREQKAPVRET